MSNVVIIGGGHAAAEMVTSLRQKGWAGGIVLISDEARLPYQRPPLSKAYFNDSVSAESLAIKKQPIYDKTETLVKLSTRVVSIDRAKQAVQLDSGEQVNYEYLIIATGTRARLLPIEGADLPCVNYLRTLDDVTKIKQQVTSGSRLLIVGAGYIGLELAASATKLGAQVTVLEAADRVLARVTCDTMSEFYQDVHRQAGVDIKLNAGVTKFSASGDHYIATLADGKELEVDCVVVGIGVLPNSELAHEAGLECDNGIVVDEFTQTSDPKVFAIGDVSNHPNLFYQRRLRLESVPNAMEQAKVAAGVICDKKQEYKALPWFWSDQYDIKLQTAGLSQGYDEVVLRGQATDKKFCLFYLKDKQLIALDAINSPQDFMKAKMLIPNKIKLDKAKIEDVTLPWFE